MLSLTEILGYYYLKFPIIFEYFDFLRDLFLAIQILIILFFIFSTKRKALFFYYFFIFLSTLLLVEFFKFYFPKLRPVSFYFEQAQFIFGNKNLFDSFPSSHTAISSSLSLAILSQDLSFGILSIVLTFLIALFSWLSLRHWPIDIFSGFIFGFLIFIIAREVLYLFHRFYIQKSKNER